MKSSRRIILVFFLIVSAGAVGASLVWGRLHPARVAIVQTAAPHDPSSACCATPGVRRAAELTRESQSQSAGALATTGSHSGMIWIPGGEFAMGSEDADARPDERPVHRVRLDGFWIDATLVTNAQFAAFVRATGYVTTAQRKPDWEQLKKQLPPDTPPPPAESLVAGSLVFRPPAGPVPPDDPSQWWQWTAGADWLHPEGPGSSIEGQDDYPVVQVSWEDAAAYARWAGKQLPTEAQFELAARGGLTGRKYAWGDEDPTDADAHPRCNIWQGHFPDCNTAGDGYQRSSPVHAFPPNGYGLYDMAGNVWEWCADWYRPDTYAADAAQGIAVDPTGPAASFDPQDPYTPARVTRGGSFLCNASYCSSYRAAARMKTSPDSSTNHIGFRCVIGRGH